MNLHNAEFIRSCVSVADCPKDACRRSRLRASPTSANPLSSMLLLRRKISPAWVSRPAKRRTSTFSASTTALYLVDLPGYGYAKVPLAEKERWGKLMEKYFAADDTLSAACCSWTRGISRRPTTWLWHGFFGQRQALRRRRQQDGQAEKKRDRAESCLHPRDTDAAGDGRADPVFGGERPRTGRATALLLRVAGE